MCGRFAFYSPKQRVIQQFDAKVPFDFSDRYNISPGQKVVILKANEDGKGVTAAEANWGLKAGWGSEKSKLLINARSETVHEKNTFKNLFKQHRCVFVADGWYEWLRENNQKTPYYFKRKDSRLFVFAGIMKPGGEKDELDQALILTREAPSPLSEIHNRSPFLLTREQVKKWLLNDSFSHVSQESINEFDISNIEFYQVSSKVNSSRNEDPSLYYPVSSN